MPSVLDVLLTQGKAQESAIPSVIENLKYIEEELKGKEFFGGERIGVVDIALGWTANLLGVFEEVAGVKFVDAVTFPRLSAWAQRFSNVPVIKRNWPPRHKLVAKYQATRQEYLAAAAATA
ncbi:glutathione transferase [Sarracenia purpurea var. burkii]